MRILQTYCRLAEVVLADIYPEREEGFSSGEVNSLADWLAKLDAGEVGVVQRAKRAPIVAAEEVIDHTAREVWDAARRGEDA